MGNEVNHYFGAYLKIQVVEQERIKLYRTCKNNHAKQSGFYCSICGGAIEEKSETVISFPHDITQLIGEEFEDVLANITPPSLFKSGTIIAIGNSANRGEWLFVDRWAASDQETDDIEIKPFPTDDEIAAMKSDFADNYAEIISVLKSCPAVSWLELCAGYVLDAEY